MYYFAYASNLSKKQMVERCPAAKARFSATLPNYKIIFIGYSRQWRGGIASIKPFRGERVTGAVYEINELDFKRLDKYEDYPNSYDHLNLIVWTESGDRIETITYIRKEQFPETKPSPEYLALIKEGYSDWQIE